MDTPSVQHIKKQLVPVLRHGARPADLIAYTPEFVNLICPAEPGMPRQALDDRALATHRILTAAVAALDPPDHEAIGLMLCLWPRTRRLTLDQRRAQAADLYGIQPDTFRRPTHEGHLLLNLAIELYQRIRDRHERRRTLPMEEEDGAA